MNRVIKKFRIFKSFLQGFFLSVHKNKNVAFSKFRQKGMAIFFYFAGPLKFRHFSHFCEIFASRATLLRWSNFVVNFIESFVQLLRLSRNLSLFSIDIPGMAQ